MVRHRFAVWTANQTANQTARANLGRRSLPIRLQGAAGPRPSLLRPTLPDYKQGTDAMSRPQPTSTDLNPTVTPPPSASALRLRPPPLPALALSLPAAPLGSLTCAPVSRMRGCADADVCDD